MFTFIKQLKFALSVTFLKYLNENYSAVGSQTITKKSVFKDVSFEKFSFFYHYFYYHFLKISLIVLYIIYFILMLTFSPKIYSIKLQNSI